MPDLISSFHERLGLNAYVSGDYDKAERHFRKLEAKEPGSLRVLRNLGVILLAKGDAEGALSYLRQEEKRFGPSFHRHAALADVAWATGDRKEAEKRYDAALQTEDIQPGGRSVALRPLIEARLAACRSMEAFARSRESNELFHRGEAARESGDPTTAIALFEQAVALDPTNWPAMNNAGTLALNLLKDPERALPLFKRAFELARAPQVARNIELAEAAASGARKGRKA